MKHKRILGILSTGVWIAASLLSPVIAQQGPGRQGNPAGSNPNPTEGPNQNPNRNPIQDQPLDAPNEPSSCKRPMENPNDTRADQNKWPSKDYTQRDDSSFNRTSAKSKGSSDKEITQKIKGALRTKKVRNLEIFTHSGKVTLKGTVDSQEEKDDIGARAAAVAGDKDVQNDLTVR